MNDAFLLLCCNLRTVLFELLKYCVVLLKYCVVLLEYCVVLLKYCMVLLKYCGVLLKCCVCFSFAQGCRSLLADTDATFSDQVCDGICVFTRRVPFLCQKPKLKIHQLECPVK